MSLIYEPLSKDTLLDVIDLAHLTWADDFKTKDSPEESYLSSIEPEKYQELWDRKNFRTLEYFTIKNEGGDVIGIAGLSTKKAETENIVWLEWYAVHPLHRGKGYGREILQWVISKVKQKKFKILRLYTSDHIDEVTAQILYDKLGFKETRREKEGDNTWTTIYKELILS